MFIKIIKNDIISKILVIILFGIKIHVYLLEMSNRNFDSRVIIQRLQNQNYARNLYQTNINGKALINNPQNSDGTSSRFTSFVPGAKTDYFRGLFGAGETISVGGTVVGNASIPSISTITVQSFTTTGSTTWTAPAGVSSLEYIIVGGGGGGGGGYDTGAGGGGGGGMVLSGTIAITPGTDYTVLVGEGGAASTSDYGRLNETAGGDGGSSSFGIITALGGGGGKASRIQTGGSGNGGAAQTLLASAVGGSGGGNAGTSAGGSGGGGGGAAAAGTNGSPSARGIGGAGIILSLSGSSIMYGAGGNGAQGNVATVGANGTSNRGNGGSGGGYSSGGARNGGAGGSGIVIIRY